MRRKIFTTLVLSLLLIGCSSTNTKNESLTKRLEEKERYLIQKEKELEDRKNTLDSREQTLNEEIKRFENEKNEKKQEFLIEKENIDRLKEETETMKSYIQREYNEKKSEIENKEEKIKQEEENIRIEREKLTSNSNLNVEKERELNQRENNLNIERENLNNLKRDLAEKKVSDEKRIKKLETNITNRELILNREISAFRLEKEKKEREIAEKEAELEELKKDLTAIDYSKIPNKYLEDNRLVENDVNYYGHTKGLDTINSLYEEAKNELKNIDNTSFNYHINDNKFTIVEYDASPNLNEEFKRIIPNVKANIQGNGKGEIHPMAVFKAFLNRDRNPQKYFEYLERKPENFDFTVMEADSNRLKELEGIINMSYGNPNNHTELRSLNKNNNYEEEYKNNDYSDDNFSKLISDNNYKQNKQLKIIAVGNGPSELEGKNTSNLIFNHYTILSPELQKKARSEVILAKSILEEGFVNELSKLKVNFNRVVYKDEYNKKYYSQSSDDKEPQKYDTLPLSLRSYTVAGEGFVIIKEGLLTGSSFAAPKISRLAYDLKEKYPFLTYHQIKQIILTTAKRDKSGYLNNVVGWGVVDREKALKGPSDFNAGLIDEQKFFQGMPSRIFDKNGNRYFYVNIPDDKKYTWENDITSGLKGNGNTLETDNITLRGTLASNSEEINVNYRIARVLDSEKLFYSNISKAGLRKDGIGTLELTGKQLYDTKTEILNGKLILKNTSNSEYVVHRNAILEINSDTNTIDINNNITSLGTVYFNSNVSMGHYLSNGKTKFHANKIVNAYSFVSNDDIEIGNIIENEKNNIIPLINSTNIIINKNKVKNIYIELFSPKNSEVLYMKIKKPRKISELTPSELRNMPMYNINESRFFEAYDKRLGGYYFSMGNVVANNAMEAKKEIFTTIYNDYVSTLFDVKDEISNNINNIDNEISEKNNSIYYKNLYSTNIFKSDVSNEFKQHIVGNLLGYDFNYKKFKVGTYAAHYYNNYNFDKYGKIKSNNFLFGLKSNINYNNINFLINTNVGYIKSDIERKILELDSKNENNSIMFNLENMLSYDFKINNIKLSPMIGYDFSLLKINKSSEKTNLTENRSLNLLVNLENNLLLKHKIKFGLNNVNKINDKLEISNKILAGVYIDTNVDLKNSILNVSYISEGRKLSKFSLDYNFGMKYKINDKFTFKSELGLNSRKKVNVSTEIKFEF